MLSLSEKTSQRLLDGEATRCRPTRWSWPVRPRQSCVLVGLAEQDLPIACKRLRDEMVSHVEADLRLTSLLATVIAWTLLDGRPRLEALPLDRFVAFLSTAFETQAGGRVIKPALRVGLSRALLATPEVEDQEVSRLQRFVERTLQRVESELGGLDPAQPLDKRFVGAALIVSAD